MWTYRAKVIRVIDGDTVDVDVDLGFGIWQKNERVRIMGIDTPESRTRDLEEKFYGLESKKYLVDLLENETVTLVSHDKGKFGRILGELFLGESNLSVNQIMIENYHAVPYFGQSKDKTEEGHLMNRAALNELGIIYESK